MADEWWHRFFGDHWARIRDGMLSPERTLAECDLLRAGFASVDIRDGKSGSAFHAKSPRAIVVARMGYD